MNVHNTPDTKESELDYGNNDDDDDDDEHLWHLHSPEYLEDQTDAAFAKEFPARTVLVPALLLTQIGISLCNVICSFAIIKAQTSYESQEFGFVSRTWLVISFANAVLPLLLLAFLRMDSVLALRIYCGLSCATFILLNISIIQAIIVLVKYYWTSSNTSANARLTVGGILLGILVRIIDIIVTGMAVFVVYEYSVLLDAYEHRRRRRLKKSRPVPNKITVENASS